MAHFAKIENGIVTYVRVLENEKIIDSDGNESEQMGKDLLNDLFGGEWVQTSYNTNAGVHPDKEPLRKNYAGIGYTYDSERDAFFAPSPFPSWILNEDTCWHEAPIPYPDDYDIADTKGQYQWDEENIQWKYILINEEGDN